MIAPAWPQGAIIVAVSPAHRMSRGDALSLSQLKKEYPLQVLVRDNNIDQALRFLKKKMQREGVFREMKQRRFYEKPSERTNREKAEAIRRMRKLARKKAQREGLLPDPRKKLDAAKAAGQQRSGFGQRARPPSRF
jgi:small subunit ribosomal protein S21